MDGIRFDALARSLTRAGSRRRALGGLLTGTLGLARWSAGEDAEAHNAATACKKKSGKARKKCLKKARAHNAAHLIPPPGPTCSDGIQNGSETAVDCGGPSCPRCLASQPCATREDCVTAHCTSGTCAICTGQGQCGSDVNGVCFCDASRVGDSGTPTGACGSSTPVTTGRSCTECPAGTICYVPEMGTFRYCLPPCGSSASCGTADACKGQNGACGRGGSCFQPLGGGPTRCGTPTATTSCGCTSHQQCEANHGAGAFCVTFTPGACTCNGFTSFCAVPR